MKIRSGFVSNSSTSSFLILGKQNKSQLLSLINDYFDNFNNYDLEQIRNYCGDKITVKSLKKYTITKCNKPYNKHILTSTLRGFIRDFMYYYSIYYLNWYTVYKNDGCFKSCESYIGREADGDHFFTNSHCSDCVCYSHYNIYVNYRKRFKDDFYLLKQLGIFDGFFNKLKQTIRQNIEFDYTDNIIRYYNINWSKMLELNDEVDELVNKAVNSWKDNLMLIPFNSERGGLGMVIRCYIMRNLYYFIKQNNNVNINWIELS